MRQWDADSYSEERTQWGYAENPSRAEKTQGQADDYREKSQEIVKRTMRVKETIRQSQSRARPLQDRT